MLSTVYYTTKNIHYTLSAASIIYSIVPSSLNQSESLNAFMSQYHHFDANLM